jgi:hypothetical protein
MDDLQAGFGGKVYDVADLFQKPIIAQFEKQFSDMSVMDVAGGYAEYILPHQVHVILHGGRAVLVGLHLPVYRIQTVDERDSHESRHYRIEGFHGDVPPDTFISIVDMLDRYFCY